MLRSPFELLEARHLLATIHWDGGGDGTSWLDPLNWDNDTVPSPADDVRIEDASSDVTVELAANVEVASVESTEHLHLVGAELKTTSLIANELTVTDASIAPRSTGGLSVDVSGQMTIVSTSQFMILGSLHVGGDLFLADETTLAADGAEASLSVIGNVNLENAQLSASGGATISISGTGGYAFESAGNNQTREFIANGVGSRIELPGLRSIRGGTHYGSRVEFTATDGGVLDLSAVRSVADPFEGDARLRSISFLAEGTGSRIDLDSLVSVFDRNEETRSRLVATSGGVLTTDSLRDLRATTVSFSQTGAIGLDELQTARDSQIEVDGIDLALSSLHDVEGSHFFAKSATLALPEVTSLRDGAITLDAGSLNAPALVDIDGTSLHVLGGATLTLPGVHSYRHASNQPGINRTWQVEGIGSRLELPDLAALTGGLGYDNDHHIQARSGGVLSLPRLQQIVDPTEGDIRFRSFQIEAIGSGSEIHLPELASIIDRSGGDPSEASLIDAIDGGLIVAPDLRELRGTRAEVESEGDIDVSKLVRIEDAIVDVNGRPARFDALEFIGDSTLSLSQTDAVLGGVTRFENNVLITDFDATVDMPQVTSIDGSGLEAYGGTRISFPNVLSYDLATAETGEMRYWVADGLGSRLDLSGVKAIRGGTGFQNQLHVESYFGGSIDLRRVEQIADPREGNSSRRQFSFTADGDDSVIRLDELEVVIDRNDNLLSELHAGGGGRIVAPNLTTLINSVVTGETSPGESKTVAAPDAPSETAPATIPEQSVTESVVSETISWIGGDGLWGEPSHWSTGRVPGRYDSVEIADANVTVTIADDQTVGGLTAAGTVTLSAGSLAFHDDSQLGDLTLSPGTRLTARGHDTQVRVNGDASIDGANFHVSEGAELRFVTASSYGHASSANNEVREWIVEGLGSRLIFESLDTITGGTHFGSRLEVIANWGGAIELGAVSRIADGVGGNTGRRAITMEATGAGSRIDLSSLSEFSDAHTLPGDDSTYSQLHAARGGTVDTSSLESLVGVSVEVDQSSSLALADLSRFDDGFLRVRHRTMVLPKLAASDGTHFVADQATIELPELAALTRGGLELQSGGSISTPALANIDGSNLIVAAGLGLELPLVTEYSHAATANSQTRRFEASGNSSRISLPNLTHLNGGNLFRSVHEIIAGDGGRIDLPALQQVSEPDAGNRAGRGIHFRSDGDGSLIKLDALTRMTDLGESPATQRLEGAHSTLSVTRDGEIAAGSLVELTGVKIETDNESDFAVDTIESATDSVFQISGDDPVSLASLTAAPGTAIRLNGSSAELPLLTTIVGGELAVRGGGTVNAPLLSQVDSATLHVSGGVTLALPAVETLTHATTANSQSLLLRAEGPGSVLDLSTLTSIDGGNHFQSVTSIEAIRGGRVNLSRVERVEEGDGGNTSQRRIDVLAEGAGSWVDLSRLVSFQDADGGSLTGSNRFSTMETRYGGVIDVGSDAIITPVLDGIYIRVEPSGRIVGALEIGPDSVLDGGGLIEGLLIIGGVTQVDGELTIDGPLQLRPGGFIEFDISGTSPRTEYDVLHVNGPALLDGTVTLRRVGDYEADAGDEYRVMSFSSRSGTPDYTGLDFGSQILSPELASDSLSFLAGFSTGPSVVSVTPSDSAVVADGPSLLITFSEAIDMATFTTADVLLDGPDGTPVVIRSLTPLSSEQFLLQPQVDPFVNGTYSIMIGPDVSDLTGNAMNQDGDQINGEPVEDQFTGNYAWLLPDLKVVGDIALDSSTYSFGDEISLSYTVRNEGPSDAGGSTWVDRVFLSQDSELDEGDLALASHTRDAALRSAESYLTEVVFTLPFDQALTDGSYHLLVSVDDAEQIREVDESNVFSSPPLTITSPPLVDLRPTSVEGPASGQPLQPHVFSWTVTNQGDLPTSGAWFDYIYLESTSDGARSLVGSVFHFDQTLHPGETYSSMMTATLPSVVDGEYRIVVLTDAGDRFFEGLNESNNELPGGSLRMTHPDVRTQSLSGPPTAQSGQSIELNWEIANLGSGSAAAWNQAIYLSRDAHLSVDDQRIDWFRVDASLGPGETRDLTRTVPLPVDADGDYLVLLVSDSDNELGELPGGESNNIETVPLSIELSPYADLQLSDFSTDSLVIGDPAKLNVDWTVTNIGTGRGLAGQWVDSIVLSENATLGDSDDVEVARVSRSSGLDVGDSYLNSETISLPPGTSGRFHVFVHIDSESVVFENGMKADNIGSQAEVDVMPSLHADLVVAQVDVSQGINAGETAEVSWTVRNQGPGITNRGDWYDLVYLSVDESGETRIEGTEARFQHFGQVAPGDEYTRTASLRIPHGLSGDHSLIVETAVSDAPFEFIFADNNRAASSAFPITQLPSPDLVVSEVVAPTHAEEGNRIDVAWTVHNRGLAEAKGDWTDRVYLQEAGDPQAEIIEVGRFEFRDSLPAGTSYVRSEVVRIPVESTGFFNLFVQSNFGDRLHESDLLNNETSLHVTVDTKPRADLRVSSISIPDRLTAGSRLAPEFSVINQGVVGTEDRTWTDRVYLSLDTVIDQADILIGELTNGSALLSGQQYRSDAGSVTVPVRYRGDVYVLVHTDAGDSVDEWPNNENNITYRSLFIEPQPLADLVVSDVVAPAQAVAGATIPVRYTVSNLGPGETIGDTWSDNIWLTRDKNRPHPGHGDLLLRSLPHAGLLAELAGYDSETTVQIPTTLESGTWYVTPWTDPLDVIAEDTLVANENPDDPGNLDNNNYRSRAIQILGARPDLVVTDVAAPANASGGDSVTVTWTVANLGFADATPGNWIDRVYLSDQADPNADGARTLLLAETKRTSRLAQGASYTATVDVPLSPSAAGQYIVVVTDDELPPTPAVDLTGFFPGLTSEPESFQPVEEVDETNNARVAPTIITPRSGNLRVTSFDLPGDARSGEEVTFQYTVTNVGADPIWPGTAYWKDFLWLSADDTFIRDRASYLGSTIHTPTGPLGPGEEYTVTFTGSLPEGTSGDYSLWVHLDAHNDQSPFLFPYLARRLRTDWYPADEGRNDTWLSHFERWAYEDPRDNLARTDLPITFDEADLQVTRFTVPAGAVSGETIQVEYEIENRGSRPTRVDNWTDRIFLSRDASLDNFDHEVYAAAHFGALAPGESYTRRASLTLPEGIEEDFHLIVFTDSAAQRDRASRPSDIGFGLVGIEFETPGSLAPWDLASRAMRETSRGTVKEYQLEGNNLASALIPIRLAPPPDLQVTALAAPERAFRGQEIEISYTVTNAGGDTVAGQSEWIDHTYLSRDPLLDLSTDFFLGEVVWEGGLPAGGEYSRSLSLSLPEDLIGSYYVIANADPDRNDVRGDVFEGSKERNNSATSAVPTTIELPPPSDLQVTGIDLPGEATSGAPARIEWTVRNAGEQTITGRWTDSVFLSSDAAWDLSDTAMGRVEFRGTLAPGESYVSSLDTNVPALTPGAYRAIVRADILNQVYEDDRDSNNTSVSETSILLSAAELLLDVPHVTTLEADQPQLFALSVPSGRTLRVSVSAGDSNFEVFLKHNEAPTIGSFDASSGGVLARQIAAVVPETRAGTYYILLDSPSAATADVTLLAELLPLAVTDLRTDYGGDSKHVTTTFLGAGFHEDAIVKLVRPGFAEVLPVSRNRVSASEIIVSFDFEDVTRGLYDIQVINPDGEIALVPYRFQVERLIEPEVTIGVGGPRYVLAGDSGTYSVSLQNLGNVDAPYVVFNVGIPELGVNRNVYNLPYAHFTSNLRGGPDGDLAGLPWPELNSAANVDGHVAAAGHLFDQPAAGFSGFTFQVQTYPGLRELHDHSWEAFKAKLYEAIPEYANSDLLADGPSALDRISPGLSLVWSAFGAIPDLLTQPLIPYQFHVVASATAMTRDEFIAHALSEADRLRLGILADDDADASLVNLAGDPEAWRALYLNYFVESGRLRAEDMPPPARRDQELVSVLATLAGGVLSGPGGSQVVATGEFTQFFEVVRHWYGHDSTIKAPLDPERQTFSSDSLSFLGILQSPNPVAALPSFDAYDLGLSANTHFQAMRVYVPWVPFGNRGAGIPPEYQISGITPNSEETFFPLNLQRYYEETAATSGLVSQTGPYTLETAGFVPAAEALPFTVHFQNDPAGSRSANEVRIIVPIDDDVDPRSVRLGDVQVGDLAIHIPGGRSLYQQELDLTDERGFLVRVSAGVDIRSRSVRWLIQAIDPLTGEVRTDGEGGLLPPNNAQGIGAGFVNYTASVRSSAATGDSLEASARVLMDHLPPEDAELLEYTIDAQAPTTTITTTRIPNTNNFRVAWFSSDDVGGSGFRHVTLYVAEEGGDFKLWQRQLAQPSGEDVFLDAAGKSYEFLALATDLAGNRETAPAGTVAADDGTTTALGFIPSVERPTTDFGPPVAPNTTPSTNPLFRLAEQRIAETVPPTSHVSFEKVLKPFTLEAFAHGFEPSTPLSLEAGIGPLAIAEAPSGDVIVSGGAARNRLYLFGEEGGLADDVWAELKHPIYQLAFDPDGRLWATTGGGPLLELDPSNGQLLEEHGDGLTLGLTVEPDSGNILVGSRHGIERFDPQTNEFTRVSRDGNLRVGSLATANDGTLYAVVWPQRDSIVALDQRGRASTVLSFETPIDSIAIGQEGTPLEGLMFVSHTAGEPGSELTMVDLASRKQVALATGGSRGDAIALTRSGSVLVSQTDSVDRLSPIQTPELIATNPAEQTVVALPLGWISLTFSENMFTGTGKESHSVLSASNYAIRSTSGQDHFVSEVRYDEASRTAFLLVNGLATGDQTLFIGSDIESAGGFPLPQGYEVRFTAISNFTSHVDLDFAGTRLDRASQTISYDVTITNTSDETLLLPLSLTLDPTDASRDAVPADVSAHYESGSWRFDLSENVPGGVRLAPGEATQTTTVRLLAPHDSRADFTHDLLATTGPNRRPEFLTLPIEQVTAGDLYRYDADAHDPDGGAVRFLLQSGPAGMSVAETPASSGGKPT